MAVHPGINRMGFTGFAEVGRKVGGLRETRAGQLELGGKWAAVVSTTWTSWTWPTCCRGGHVQNGQVCCTATRWLLHERIYDALWRGRRAHAGGAGRPRNGARYGHGRHQREAAQRHLSTWRAGTRGRAAILAGGKSEVAGCEGGFYVKPAMLAGNPDNVCAREEIFGPLATSKSPKRGGGDRIGEPLA